MSDFVPASGVGRPWIYKDPAALLHYTEDWSAWLAPFEDEIDTIAWTVPDGITQASASASSSSATIWLDGGTHGRDYELRCAIETVGGRKDVRSFRIKCRTR